MRKSIVFLEVTCSYSSIFCSQRKIEFIGLDIFELFPVAESGSGDDLFIIRLIDLWHKQWNVDVHNESCICSLYAQLQQLEHAKQSQQSPTQVILSSAFFVTVRAGTAYQKIWRLVNNLFCSHNKVDCSEIPIVLSNLLYHYFFIELWHILILWLAKMPNLGMPVFTLIATGWRHCWHARG